MFVHSCDVLSLSFEGGVELQSITHKRNTLNCLQPYHLLKTPVRQTKTKRKRPDFYPSSLASDCVPVQTSGKDGKLRIHFNGL